MGANAGDFEVHADEETGRVVSVTMCGEEMLDTDHPSPAEIFVNGLPLQTRAYPIGPDADHRGRLKGERWVDHFSGWGLVAARRMGARSYMKFNSFGVNYQLRREICDATDLPCPGPGGPAIEAPMYVDTFGLMNWNWKFWGDKTRMIFPSSHTQGPADEFGHIGYEHETPANCKKFMQNVWRRTYPGCMAVHGGLFYNIETEHWIAITCRRPHVGYALNIKDAGEGVGYDFTLHAPFNIGDSLRMPEVKIYYGRSREEMMQWLGWYITFYYEEAPEWTRKTLWGHAVTWNNQPTWGEQADYWERELDKGTFNGISYCLVTNRAIMSGTTPTGYEPDPNHGTEAEFKAMCRRIADRGVPLLIWMSHSGIQDGAHEVEDDWFIRGIDGRWSAGWGSREGGMIMCNPGHPGYIEYTKKWIRFYMTECGCKGIFFDCLGWVFPADFTPRDFMRYPGDTNLMTIRFMREIYACIKECDPEGIMLGEGVSLDGPVNVFSIAGNPVRAIDGMGPRDFFLQLNRYAPKKMTVDQGGDLLPSSGMSCIDERPGSDERNRFFLQLLQARGGRDAFTHLVGDLSIQDDLLFLAVTHSSPPNTPFHRAPDVFALPAPWEKVTRLVEKFDATTIDRGEDGKFHGVSPGIYQMIEA